MTTPVAIPQTRRKRVKKVAPDSVPPSPYTLSAALTRGDIFTRCSAIVFGLGNFVRHQFVKGAILLIVEAIFIFYLIRDGISCLTGLSDLGPVTEATQMWDENGNYINVNPTNSVEVLLYGVAWILLIIAFVIFWATAVKSAYKAQCLAMNGKAPGIQQDLKDMLDTRIQVTLMSLPVLGLLLFTVLPLIFMISMAFTSFDQNHTPAFNWVGLQNFAAVLSTKGSAAVGVNLTLFMRVLAWTLVWAFLATFLNFFLGMFMAMIILRKGTRLKSLWRALFSMSIAVPQFVSLLVINQMLRDQGIINQMLKSWGWIDASLPFLTNEWWARGTVIIVNLWIGIPYTIMQITGILQNIPADLYEASRIDGASMRQSFIYITMPYIFFVMTPYLITTFTANVNNFNVIYLLTNGQPTSVGDSAGKTDLLITWLYKLTVDKGNFNVGAVIGILTFIVLGVVSLITYRSSGSYRNEEGFR